MILATYVKPTQIFLQFEVSIKQPSPGVGKPWDARQNDTHHLWCDAQHVEPITMSPGGVFLQ